MTETMKEKILEAACDLCHWPWVYRDDVTMHDERCAYCPMKMLLEGTTDVDTGQEAVPGGPAGAAG